MTERVPPAANLPPLGEDPMDRFSELLHSEELRTSSGRVIGKRIVKQRRENPEKPGRTLAVSWDSRTDIDPDFKGPHYMYLVRFSKPAGETVQAAGRHYHQDKNELFTAASGRFEVVLEDRQTKEQVRVVISADERGPNGEALETAVYAPAGTAHAVSPLDDGESTLLVTADWPNNEADEFPYDMSA